MESVVGAFDQSELRFFFDQVNDDSLEPIVSFKGIQTLNVHQTDLSLQGDYFVAFTGVHYMIMKAELIFFQVQKFL